MKKSQRVMPNILRASFYDTECKNFWEREKYKNGKIMNIFHSFFFTTEFLVTTAKFFVAKELFSANFLWVTKLTENSSVAIRIVTFFSI